MIRTTTLVQLGAVQLGAVQLGAVQLGAWVALFSGGQLLASHNTGSGDPYVVRVVADTAEAQTLRYSEGALTQRVLFREGAPRRLPIVVEISTNLAVCRESPEACEGTERGFEICSDGEDNDLDGLSDADDPDCSAGVSGWSYGLIAPTSARFVDATTDDTAASPQGTRFGFRDLAGGSFLRTELLDPEDPEWPINGLVSACVLSFTNHVTLPLNEALPVLRSTVELSSEATESRLELTEIEDCAVCRNGRWTAAFTVAGETVIPTLEHLELEIRRGLFEASFRVDLDHAGAEPTGPTRRVGTLWGAVPWQLTTDRQDSVRVAADIIMETRIEGCLEGQCRGGENFVGLDDFGVPSDGCSDGIDNDGNGLADQDDPDCRGVQGWSYMGQAEPCFQLEGISIEGTLAALDTMGGARDSIGGNFEKTQLTAGEFQIENGFVSACVLSFTRPFIAPQTGDRPVARLLGELTVPDPLSSSDDTCFVTVLPGEQLLFKGAPETAVTIQGETHLAPAYGAEITIRSLVSQFIRGDTNSDGLVDLSDPIALLNHRFLGGDLPNCEDAHDFDDSGEVNLSDAIFGLSFLFLQGALPPSPGPRQCGWDATDDTLDCVTEETSCAF